ncbi:hypothetical protein [Bordetella tumulicola]|uniref:hypothetical protein n=1 Tax=Bordetella tumulicola TaxID=1649133 RepID=UPI0039F1498E
MPKMAINGRSPFVDLSAANRASASVCGTTGACATAVAAGKLNIQPAKPSTARMARVVAPQSNLNLDIARPVLPNWR